MGWKNIKDHYRIGHIVSVGEKGILVGSVYIHDLIVISHDGSSVEWGSIGRCDENRDLSWYYAEMKADPDRLKRLARTPDEFSKAIPVYTFEEETGRIVEAFCEEPGWPNVTHDGALMYENRFSTNREEVVRWARENLQAAIEYFQSRLKEEQERLETTRQQLDQTREALARLEEREMSPTEQAPPEARKECDEDPADAQAAEAHSRGSGHDGKDSGGRCRSAAASQL